MIDPFAHVEARMLPSGVLPSIGRGGRLGPRRGMLVGVGASRGYGREGAINPHKARLFYLEVSPSSHPQESRVSRKLLYNARTNRRLSEVRAVIQARENTADRRANTVTRARPSAKPIASLPSYLGSTLLREALLETRVGGNKHVAKEAGRPLPAQSFPLRSQRIDVNKRSKRGLCPVMVSHA